MTLKAQAAHIRLVETMAKSHTQTLALLRSVGMALSMINQQGIDLTMAATTHPHTAETTSALVMGGARSSIFTVIAPSRFAKQEISGAMLT
jgi:hypothetical protein